MMNCSVVANYIQRYESWLSRFLVVFKGASYAYDNYIFNVCFRTVKHAKTCKTCQNTIPWLTSRKNLEKLYFVNSIFTVSHSENSWISCKPHTNTQNKRWSIVSVKNKPILALGVTPNGLGCRTPVTVEWFWGVITKRWGLCQPNFHRSTCN